MLFLARKLVPSIHPDYVIVQYSPWLAERSSSPFAPTNFGRIPQPYLFGRDTLAIHPPVFRARVMDLPWQRYTDTPRSFTDFISFFWNAGMPLAIHDGGHLMLFHTRQILGLVPRPTVDRGKLERFVYHEIAQLGSANNAKLILVVLAVGAEPVTVPNDIAAQYMLVDANTALIKRLTSPTRQNWISKYAHLRGDPPKPVDFHPNQVAHRIIADEIIFKIGRPLAK